ncbi:MULTISPECIES: response regulator [Sphingobacterium]|uniref:Response regulator n=1 Tax=Sphingobacterium kitahiroshimense TaxID=470446 RepID=A0ABV0BTX8_9SPHI|nr:MULTISPECIES: response regulator [Sphingobacterium]MCW2261350.1 CheY-like chemotaxis protein [Sphingobacterium kitahiroshimense]TCR07825.1 response regulator receiver domain-containing protein [Sphingobacterium sp. JUb78]
MGSTNTIKIRTVTLVDDNAILRVIFSNMIKSFPDFPLQINLFENALDALEYFENKKENLDPSSEIIFVDINMPFMTGWEMMDKLEEFGHDFLNLLNIYIISSSTSRTDREQIQDYPFIDGYILKPIDKLKLYELIRKLNNEA